MNERLLNLFFNQVSLIHLRKYNGVTILLIVSMNSEVECFIKGVPNVSKD